MELKRLHHVAFAHDDRGITERLGALLNLHCLHTETGAGFVECMLPIGDSYVQLLESTGDGIVQRFIDRRGSALHHVAFEIENLDTALAELRDAGVRLIDTQPREGGMGTRIAFIHPSAFGGLLVELVEQPARHLASSD